MHATALLAAALAASAVSAPPQPLTPLSAPPQALGARSTWQAVPVKLYYEVPASRSEQAAEWLGSADFLPLKKERENDVFFSAVDARCRGSNQVVLLKA